MMPVWLFLGSLSLGLPNSVLSVLVPLKCTCIPFLLHSFLNFSPCPWHVWNYYDNVLFVVAVVLWVVVVGVVVVAGLVGVGELVVPLVEGPIWKLALL